MEERAVEEGRRWSEGGIREFLWKNKGGGNWEKRTGSEESFMKEQRGEEEILGNLLRQICTLRKGGCYPFFLVHGLGG